MHHASPTRYDQMQFRKPAKSGLKLPILSLGLWQNFGPDKSFDSQKEMILRSFDLGIFSFDLADIYANGEAEKCFGKVIRENLSSHRDELIIATKAGHRRNPGPNGIGGSRKRFMESINESLTRLGVDYVDLYYHHIPDPETPLEETAYALNDIVKQGKALYVGISKYSPEDTRKMTKLMIDAGTPLLVHQHKYSMFVREPENGLHQTLADLGLGGVAFSSLDQGLLTDKYLSGIPQDSRAAKNGPSLKIEYITPEKIEKIQKMSVIAEECNTNMSGLAMAWALRNPVMTTLLLGASRVSQIEDAVTQFQKMNIPDGTFLKIEKILSGERH